MLKHEIWAYMHWTVGRACFIFAIVNLFLGIGRYRTLYGLGSWADEVLGCYLAALVVVGSRMLDQDGG